MGEALEYNSHLQARETACTFWKPQESNLLECRLGRQEAVDKGGGDVGRGLI